MSCGYREEDFFMYFHYKSIVDNHMPGTWPVWTPGAPLAGFTKYSTYIATHKIWEFCALCLVPCGLKEEGFFMFVPL